MAVLIQLASRAITAISRLTLGGPGRRAATATLAGLGVATGAFGIPGVDLFPNGGGGGGRRRRRRPMFTSTDLAQFAAAESIAGKSAARSLMMIRAAKS